MLLIAFLVPFFLVLSPGDYDKPKEEVAWVYELVRSDDPYRSAWGAYYAGKYGLKGCASAIRNNLERANESDSRSAHLARAVAMDALIRLEDHVPARLVTARFDKTSLDESILLLATDGEGNLEALHQLLDHLDREKQTWWVAAALLAARDSPDLAEILFEGLTLRLTVVVRDPGSASFNDTLRFGGSASSRSGGRYWPPSANYKFSFESISGYTVLQVKPIPLYYKRTERKSLGESTLSVFPRSQSRHAVKFLLAMIDGPRGDLLDDSEDLLHIDWDEEVNVLEQIEPRYRRLVVGHDLLKRRLCDSGLLSLEAERNIQPCIEIVLKDERLTKEPPLPAVTEVK